MSVLIWTRTVCVVHMIFWKSSFWKKSQQTTRKTWKITQNAKSWTSHVLNNERFLLKSVSKRSPFHLAPSSPLNSLYEIYYIETHFCMLLLNSGDGFLFSKHYQSITHDHARQLIGLDLDLNSLRSKKTKVVKGKHCRPRITSVFVKIKSYNSTGSYYL